MNQGTAKDAENRPPQFCILEYSTGGANQPASIVLLALKDADGNLTFRVDPEWRKIVQPADLDYFESLLLDLSNRTQLNPDDLFEQISSLSVGPLITRETGAHILNHPDLLAQFWHFVEL